MSSKDTYSAVPYVYATANVAGARRLPITMACFSSQTESIGSLK